MSFLRRRHTPPLADRSSPIVDGGEVHAVATIGSGDVIDLWRSWAGVDMSDSFPEPTTFELLECRQTGLEFTWSDPRPSEPLSPSLASRLRSVERRVYDQPWEQSWALRDLEGRRRLLLADNGDDPIVQHARDAGFNAQATSRSATTTIAAQRLGYPVEHLTLPEAALIYRNEFDAVAAFELLDRAPDPGRTLRNLIDLVKPDGEIVVSVNYADSDVERREDAILLPPVGFSRWSEDTFRCLPDHLPVALESLAVGQIGDESSGVHRSRFKSQFDLTEALTHEFPEASSRALARLALRRFSSGQRLYARLRRLS